jgi:hypothetical protein
MAPVFAPGPGPVPLYKALDAVAAGAREWERDGAFIRFKSKTWAHDRRCEIPARYMKRWLAVREKKGGLALDDLAEIASLLKDAQVENLMYSAMEEGATDFTDFLMVTMNRDPLRFWANLLPLQRRNLVAGAQIPARSLYPRQQQALIQLTLPKTQSMFAAFMGSKAQRTPQELSQAVVSLERTDLPARQPGAQPAPEAGPEAQGLAAFGATASGLVTLRVAFPNGQKDEYRIPMMRPAPKPAVPKPPPVPEAQG